MTDQAFPFTLTIDVPFPTPRHAEIALRALSVDKELSPLVRRALSVASAGSSGVSDDGNVLHISYAATTNRMLRVAVNGFFASLGVVMEVMEELDVDVVDVHDKEMDLTGVQGLSTLT